VVDARDATNKPSFANLKAKDISELAGLLKRCLKSQIYALRASADYDQNLDFALTKLLRKFKTQYASILKKA